MTSRHNRHNNFRLACAASALAAACLFSVATASAAPLRSNGQEGSAQGIVSTASDAASNTAAMPNNPDTPLPDTVSNAIPDDAVAVSSDLAVTPNGTVKDVTTGATVADPKIVGTEQAPPDPLAKTNGEKFIPIPISTVKKALGGQGDDSADSVDSAASAAAATTAKAAVTSATLATTAAATQSRAVPASLQNNGYGAYWGQYHGSPAFFESGGALFAQQAKGVIDVSAWQGSNIDWAKAKAAGVQGAIIRLGFGWNNAVDADAQRNINECKRLGIPFGVYWFSYAEKAGDGGSEGADMVAKLRAAGVKPGDMKYPAFYDLEKWTWYGHASPNDPNTYTGMVNTWSAQMQSAGYANLSVYSYADYFKHQLNSSSIHARARWVASYGPHPGFSISTNDRGWQYANSGHINGIAGNVDLSAFGVRTAPAAPAAPAAPRPDPITIAPAPLAPKPSAAGSPVAVYRVYNRNSGLHHYTTNPNERAALIRLGWNDEGTSFYAVQSGSAKSGSLKPVYREYNPHDGNHNWTLNPNEHRTLVKLGWRDEGVAWYANPAGPVTVYRLYNPHSGEHVYTTSTKEYAAVGAAGWRQEGTAWKGL